LHNLREDPWIRNLFEGLEGIEGFWVDHRSLSTARRTVIGAGLLGQHSSDQFQPVVYWQIGEVTYCYSPKSYIAGGYNGNESLSYEHDFLRLRQLIEKSLKQHRSLQLTNSKE